MKSTDEIALLRKEEHERAWNRVKDKISEGQVVSRCCKKYQTFWCLCRNRRWFCRLASYRGYFCFKNEISK